MRLRLSTARLRTFHFQCASRPLQLLVRFGRWDDIMQTPEPAEELLHARAVWHYARGRLLAAHERTD
jgi:hypothetical protein